uniref:protein Lines homolog 1 n=1 Tax=Centroberyx gerrardi TaxID=166262 RepID=UPI003AAC4CCB
MCSCSCSNCTIMRNHFDSVTEAYRCLLRGSCLSQSAGDVASVIVSAVCGLSPVQERDCSHLCQPKESSDSEYESRVDLTCITLTLVEKISSSLMSQSMPPEVSLYFMEVLRVLFQEGDFMSKLVHQFQAEDQLISHLAAKTVSTYTFYELQISGTFSPVWQQECVQVFHNSSPCNELDACMWSFTDVLKKLLKGSHEEILWKLLAAFDPGLSALCSRFLPEERKEARQSAVDFTSTEHWGTTLSTLLDLLEVLTASRRTCRTGVCLQSQRLTHVHASALLRIVDSPSKYFVKKRALLLLKKALLQKAGEDMALGDVSAAGMKDEQFSADVTTLADGVLQAVSADWLQRVQVEAAASFFGGSCRVEADGDQKPDHVMIRAVSLVVLKSMELKIQLAGGTGVSRAVAVHGYLQALSGFLRQQGVPPEEASHRCCWFTLLFGEQDDDMMEAAKALLSIFLHHRLSSGLHDAAASEAACASGCNPHCHFLLLLRSVSFDHSILLDFLISTETCFLEYLVRYLKHLRADWEGFTLACRRIEALCVPPSTLIPAVDGASLASGLRLVDYGSSEESDTEDMEVSDDSQGNTGPRSRGSDVMLGTSGPPAPIVRTEHEPSDSTARAQTDPSSAPERGTRGSCPNITPLSRETPRSGAETSRRTISCLSELRAVVARLRMKKLFPYNPSSLLKLLAQVETAERSQP